MAPRSFEGRVRRLVDGHVMPKAVADALLASRTMLEEQLNTLPERLVWRRGNSTRVPLLLSTPVRGCRWH
jgi:hypothetical protein